MSSTGAPQSKIIDRPEQILNVSQERLLPSRDGVLAYGARGGSMDYTVPFSADSDGCLMVRGEVIARQQPGEAFECELLGPNVTTIVSRLTAMEKQMSALVVSLSNLPALLSLMNEQLRELASLKVNAQQTVAASSNSADAL